MRQVVKQFLIGVQVLELLFTNLQIRNRNSRVTAQEAEQLADVIIESRPLAGFEDFLRRIVLPAGGLDDIPDDATVVPAVFSRLADGVWAFRA